MADFKQAFGSATEATFPVGTPFATLAAAATAVSDEVNNSTLYDEIILEIKANYSETNQTTAWLDIRIYASIDGGTDYSTWQNPYLVLPAFDLSAAGSSTTAIYHARFIAPQRWKIAIKSNMTTNALDVGTVYWQGVYYTGI